MTAPLAATVARQYRKSPRTEVTPAGAHLTRVWIVPCADVVAAPTTRVEPARGSGLPAGLVPVTVSGSVAIGVAPVMPIALCAPSAATATTAKAYLRPLVRPVTVVLGDVTVLNPRQALLPHTR